MQGSDPFGGSFKVARVADVDVKVHVLFVLFVGLSMLSTSDPAGQAVFFLVLFGSVLVHELAHVLGARRMGGDADEVILWPLGGLAPLRLPQGWRPDLVASAAGPLSNLLLAVAGVAILLLTGGTEVLRDRPWDVLAPRARETALTALARDVAGINAYLFILNILPAPPLDGGSVWRAALWPLVGWRRATIAIGLTGLLVGAGFLALAVLARGMGTGLIAVFVLLASWQMLQAGRTAGGWER